MKLVDDSGRFTLVKNGIVEIDFGLLKYKQIVEEQEKKALEVASSEIASVEGTIFGDGPSSLIDAVTPAEVSSNVDEDLRKKIEELNPSNLKDYLLSESAVEFNKEFIQILLGEFSANRFSLGIPPSNRLTYGNTAGFVDVPMYGSPFRKFMLMIKSLFKQPVEEVKKAVYSMKVLDFFNVIHIETGKEHDFINRLDGYFKLIKNASAMHQDAQRDELCQKIVINIYESVLAAHGYNKYITFADIENMKHDGKRVVDIDYLKDFGRVIPQDVVDKKIQCDNFCVFDNYCVLYYDPSGKTYKKTSAAKRDPILFGLINHSEKLYYIADWIDETCDLTLEKVAELCAVSDIK